MCLAIPGTITEINGDTAVLDYGDLKTKASSILFPNAKIGDIALVHAGFIIQILPEEEGKELEDLVSETLDFDDGK
jgi:hydrogenase expression/formation protein HypC